MKQFFLLFGISACTLTGYAQQLQQTGNRFGVSVFADSRDRQPLQRADIATAQKLKTSFPGWYIQTDKWTGGFKDLNGRGRTIPGSTLADKALYCMDHELRAAGIQSGDWTLNGQATNKKGFTYLYYGQTAAGHKIAFTKMVFRFDPSGKLTRITSKGYGAADISLKPLVSKEDALRAALQELDGVVVTTQQINADWEWFPVPSEKGYTLHPAYTFTIEGHTQNGNDIPLNMTGYVDALTGDLLYRDNETKDATDLKVVASVYKDGVTRPVTTEPLADMAIKIGSSTYYTDADGFFSTTAHTLPTTDTVFLMGKWSVVRAKLASDITPRFVVPVTTAGTTYTFPTTAPSSSRHINAYYHVGRVHDYMKSQLTTFTDLDYPLVTNVDNTGSCNAFYTSAAGSSINFYAAGGGCNSFAEIGDIVYHEYGHAISNKFYVDMGVSSMMNGALNEGNSDIWAISITEHPILGEGTSSSGGGLIRRYDLAPKVYPKDIVGQVHADGEIIAGAWWDVAVNLSGNVKKMGELFASTYYDVPDGPNGTEGEVYFEVLMSALINDDDDADLSNGTPNFDAIAKAFARHGIYLLNDAVITHTELEHQPAGVAIPVKAGLALSNPTFFQSMKLMYKVRGGSWDTLVMTETSPGSHEFIANIPAKTEGTLIDYYFTANDLLNNSAAIFPEKYRLTALSQGTLPYQFGVGLSVMQRTDFESPATGWEIGLTTDNAGTGKWIQAKPIASYVGSALNQTGSDHTTGSGQCLITGNAASAGSPPTTQSVKNGVTTVMTPTLTVSGYTNPIIEYYRWFGNDKGNSKRKDNWQVQISVPGGTFWRDVDNTYQSDFQWRRRIFAVKDYFVGTDVVLRFMAKDIRATGVPSSLVEAGIDDFVVYEGKEGLSVPGAEQLRAMIYPNPAADMLQIVLPSGSFREVSVNIYDMGGKLVSTLPVDRNTTRYTVDTKSLPSGQYMMMIQMDKTVQAQKVTVLHQ